MCDLIINIFMNNNSCNVLRSGPARAQTHRGQAQRGGEQHERWTNNVLRVHGINWTGAISAGESINYLQTGFTNMPLGILTAKPGFLGSVPTPGQMIV